MKKTILLISMCIMALGFTACSDDENEERMTVVPSGMTIQASTEGDLIALRTALQGDDQNGYKVAWSKGDQIVAGNKVFYLTDGSGTTKGTFIERTGAAGPTLVDNKRYDVLYGLTSKNLPEKQVYTPGQTSNAPMHAQITVSNGKASEAKFKNLCGLLRLTVKGSDTIKVKNIMLSADRPIAGPFDIGSQGNAIMQNNGGTSITLDCKGATLTPEGTDFYIALPPNSYSDVKIDITTTDEKICTQTLNFSIDRAKITSASLVAEIFTPAALEAVDLGLPSGLKWANCNIGASKPEENGSYYAWGEIEAKNTYSWDTYFDTDCTEYSQTSKTVLDLKDDAAHAKWGKNWRMPTCEEIEELVKKCYWVWTTDYKGTGVAGYAVYKADEDDKGKMTNTNERYSQSPSREYTLSDNHIFLPAAGYHYEDKYEFSADKPNGYYMSSSLYQGENKRAYIFNFNKSTTNTNDNYWVRYYYRFYGSSVRAVWAE